MVDVLLHILGAAIMMVPVALSSTPVWLAFPWAVCVAGFWFVREWAQKRSIKDWSGWKIAEAAAPAATALLCAGGVTLWRLA